MSEKIGKRIYLSSPTMNGNEMKYIEEAFRTNWIAPLGANVDGFEKDLAEFTGIPYAVAMSSGTEAIHMALKYAGVGRGDIVFCSSFTFAASCNPIAYLGAEPVFIDSETETWNMDPELLELAFKAFPQVKAVIVVNLYGTPAKLNEIKAICNAHKVPLIEDAAESLGASYAGIPTGSFGDYGAFSFNGNKIITTSGGGMLLSKDKAAIEKIKFWITQSREKARHYEHKEIGYNCRMSNIVAGIGRGQMKTIKNHIRKKKEIYDKYRTAFADIPAVSMNPYIKNPKGICKPNFWLSCMTINRDSSVTPDMIMDALESENIESRPLWKPMHLQPVFKDAPFVSQSGVFNSGEIDCPEGISGDAFRHGLCLPSDIKNTEEDMDRIIRIVKTCFSR